MFICSSLKITVVIIFDQKSNGPHRDWWIILSKNEILQQKKRQRRYSS